MILLCGDVQLNPGAVHNQRSNELILKCYYQNIESVNNKLLDCTIHLPEFLLYDCIIFSETWLNENISSAEIPFPQHFNVCRSDRGNRAGSKQCVF